MKRYGKSARYKRRRDRRRAIVYRARLVAFVEAASRPGARLLVAPDVFDALRLAWAPDPWLRYALLKLNVYIEPLLSHGKMVALPRFEVPLGAYLPEPKVFR
jgi:hypothetical protein